MKTYRARVRVTYYEEWEVEADTEEEARTALEKADTTNGFSLEMVDWEIAGKIKSEENA